MVTLTASSGGWSAGRMIAIEGTVVRSDGRPDHAFSRKGAVVTVDIPFIPGFIREARSQRQTSDLL